MSADEIRERVERSRAILGAVALVSLVFPVYGVSLTYGFYFDDFLNIVNNEALRKVPAWLLLSGWPEKLERLPDLLGDNLLRPLLAISYAIDFPYWKLSPVGYHYTSLLLHALSGIFLFLIVRSEIRRRSKLSGTADGSTWSAWMIAGLFVLHPIQSEAAIYISARPVVLSAFFQLAAFFMLQRVLLRNVAAPARRVFPALLVAGWLAFAAALFSGPGAILLPLYLALYDWGFLRTGTENGEARGGRISFYMPLFLLAVCFAVVYLTIPSQYRTPDGSPNPYSLIATHAAAWWRYLALLVFPFDYTVDHGLPHWESIFSLWPILSLLGITWALIAGIWFWNRARASGRLEEERPLVALAAGLGLALAASAGFVPHPYVLQDHRAYLAVAWFLLLAGQLWPRIVKAVTRGHGPLAGNKSFVKAAPFVLVGLYLFCSIYRVSVWDSSEKIWSEAVRKSPRHPRPHYQLGVHYMAEGKSQEALDEFGRALKLDPGFYLAAVNRGVLLLQGGDNANAEANFLHALKVNPKHAPALYNLAELYEHQGRLEEALQKIHEAQALVGKDGTFLEKEGDILSAQGKYEEALDRYSKALEAGVDDRQHLLRRMGNVALQNGYYDTASKRFEQAVTEFPRSPEDRFNLALFHEKREQYDRAVENYRGALLLDPGMAQAHFNLARVYEMQKNCSGAAMHYELAGLYGTEYRADYEAFKKAQKEGLRCPVKKEKKGPF